MNQDYKDITDKLGQPIWWDECAVPRYCEFHPSKVNNIYSEEVILLEIGCQECAFRFNVAISYHILDKIIRNQDKLSERVVIKAIHYGDPPNYCSCSAGATMNCIDIKVLEFWKRNKMCEWERIPELEVEIEGDSFWENEYDISFIEILQNFNEEEK